MHRPSSSSRRRTSIGNALVPALILSLALAACSEEGSSPLGPEDGPDPAPAAIPAEGRTATPVANGRIFFSAPGPFGDSDLAAMNLDGSGPLMLTPEPGEDHSPAVSPDGRRVAFVRERAGTSGIYVMRADGTEFRALVTFGTGNELGDLTWSPDGRRIAFAGRLVSADDPAPDFDLYVMTAGGKNLRRLLGGPGESNHDHQPSWSADGALLAFTRGTGLFARIMTVNRDGSNVHAFASCEGGCGDPAWSPIGARLAYAAGGSLVVKTAGQPAEIIGSDLRPGAGGPTWAPDGSSLVYPGVVNGGVDPRLLVVNQDGTGPGQLPTLVLGEESPSWARR